MFFWIHSINDEHIEFILERIIDKVLEGIGKYQVRSSIIEAAWSTAYNTRAIAQSGQVFLRDLDDHLVNFYHSYAVDGLVAQDLA